MILRPVTQSWRTASPLRYPGGKWRLNGFITRLIRLNDLKRVHYVEPYAGGASLALNLLFSGVVEDVHLNDINPAIFAFWKAILKYPKAFANKVATVPLTPEEWRKQKSVYKQGLKAGLFELGFATFFLSRTNHSGILNAGMIGGNDQDGPWKMDARFNRMELQDRIKRAVQFRERIHVSRQDAVDFIDERGSAHNTFMFLDPPYYLPGKRLYLNAYSDRDHSDIRRRVSRLRCPWIVSYDDVKPIKDLYRDVRSRKVELLHTARSARKGIELLFFSPSLRIPKLTYTP